MNNVQPILTNHTKTIEPITGSLIHAKRIFKLNLFKMHASTNDLGKKNASILMKFDASLNQLIELLLNRQHILAYAIMHINNCTHT